MPNRSCTVCRKDREPEEFPTKTAAQCRQCKMTRARARDSRTPEAYLQALLVSNKARAAKRGLSECYSITLNDLIAMWHQQKGLCAISGTTMSHHKDGTGTADYNVSLDRKNGNNGYSPDNVQLVCYRANMMKHELSEGMFYWWVKTINNFSCD